MIQKKFNISFLGKDCTALYIKEKSLALTALEDLMDSQGHFAIDIETMPLPQYLNVTKAGLSPHLATPRLIQIYDSQTNIIYVFDVLHIDCLDIFLSFLESKKLIAHNAIFELQFFKMMGVKNCEIGCTLLLAKLIYHAIRGCDFVLNLSLDGLCDTFLKVKLAKTMQVSNWSERELTFEQIQYAALDPLATYLLAAKLAPGINKHGLSRIYALHKRTQSPVAEMQLNGMGINDVQHKRLIQIWRGELFEARKEVIEHTSLQDITSHKIAKWLETHLTDEELRIWPKTPGGSLSTNKDALKEFSYLAVVEPFSNLSKKETLLSTFGDSLRLLKNPATGRIHSQFLIGEARTGRFSSRGPNAQNYPSGIFRELFVARPGKSLICADYSQVELRIAAEISQDPVMLDAYRNGLDLHTITASNISGVPYDKVTKPQRQLGKALGFGLLYGIGPVKFSKYAKANYGVTVSEDDAKVTIDKYRELYKDLRKWQLEISGTPEMYTTTICGKKRALIEKEEYGGKLNTRIQGSAAEAMEYALCFLDDEFKGTNVELLATVHDEVLLECDTDIALEVRELTDKHMVNGYLEVLPGAIIKDLVDAKIGQSWGAAK